MFNPGSPLTETSAEGGSTHCDGDLPSAAHAGENKHRRRIPTLFRRMAINETATASSASIRLYAYRSGFNNIKSREGFSPETISATSFPVTGARLSPIMAWPVAKVRFSNFAVRPK